MTGHQELFTQIKTELGERLNESKKYSTEVIKETLRSKMPLKIDKANKDWVIFLKYDILIIIEVIPSFVCDLRLKLFSY